jgi:Heterokaryon incompatibility protein (HET)
MATQDNFENHERDMRLDRFPRTIHDAILAARKLGFNYAWIGALCIVQEGLFIHALGNFKSSFSAPGRGTLARAIFSGDADQVVVERQTTPTMRQASGVNWSLGLRW